MEKSDKELINAYLKGSEAAFEQLYERYRRPLYGYLRSMFPAADADDLFQRCWVKACSALPGYRCEGKFQAWIFRIARNQALDLHRRRKRRGESGLEELSAEPENHEEPGAEITERELCAKLEEALSLLAPEQRIVFELRREKVSFRLIAEKQECSVGTAVMRMQYAIKKLKRTLEDWK